MSYEPTIWQDGDLITQELLNKIENGVLSMNNSYTPTTWADGDIITAEGLNNIEEGIYAGVNLQAFSVTFMSEDAIDLLSYSAVVDGRDATYGGSTPTKTATAQYTYTFDGWSSTQAGALDTDALKDITANKTVYAHFNATVNTYTVRFYNGSTLLETVNDVPYGSTATYSGETPVDTEHDPAWEFGGWSPSNVNITGDTDCVAQFISPEPSEISDDIDTIVTNINNGTANYRVGDFKTITTSQGTYALQIIGRDKDTLTSGGTADYTLACKPIITTHNMNSTATTEGGFTASEMKTYLVDTVLPTLPESLRNSIKSVSKVTKNYVNSALVDETSNETIFLLSEREVGGTGTYCEASGPVYDGIFSDNASRIKYNLSGNAISWWLRSSCNASSFRYVGTDGSFYYNGASNTRGVVFGFCLSEA